MRNKIQKLIPSDEALKTSKGLRWLRPLLARREIFIMTRKSTSRGFAVGMLWGWMPLPVPQMLCATLNGILMAMINKPANVPVAAVTVWFSNPLTWAPVWFFAYYFGTLVFGYDLISYDEFEFTWTWVKANFETIAVPLYGGATILGLISAFVGYYLIYFVWTWSVMRRYSNRHNNRPWLQPRETREVSGFKDCQKKESEK